MKYITRIVVILLSISLVTFIIITINIDNSIKRLEDTKNKINNDTNITIDNIDMIKKSISDKEEELIKLKEENKDKYEVFEKWKRQNQKLEELLIQ
ncbi:unknown [Clostridium sp. CAG:762]|nr:unknown [Clostridium sp. CAG:762]